MQFLLSGAIVEIKWLKKALRNLDDQAEFIAKDNPIAARQVVQHIHNTVLLLADNPGMGHAGRVSGTHELVIPNNPYIVPYRVRPRLQRIEILRVLHTSRKHPKPW